MKGDTSMTQVPEGKEPRERKPYAPPKLVKYGEVRHLTQSNSANSSEGSSGGGPMKPSERGLKQNIVRVGEHSPGIGLYVFEYRPGHADLPAGRQFGVMADEVEAVLPQAVQRGTQGFRIVDYGRLGITFRE
jgi:hypothetical protein